MPRRTHPYDDAADRELAKWPGVVVLARVVVSSGHRHLILEYKGQRRFVVHPASPSDSRTGARNHVQDIRRVLRQIDERNGK
jgi:hypothetical protein